MEQFGRICRDARDKSMSIRELASTHGVHRRNCAGVVGVVDAATAEAARA